MKMVVLPKAIYKGNGIIIKIPTQFFTEVFFFLKKFNFKWKHQKKEKERMKEKNVMK